MPLLLVIVGLVVVVAGIALLFTAQFKRTSTVGAQQDGAVSDALAEFNKLLAQIEQKFRLGIVVIAAGLVLVGIGAYLEAHDAHQAVDDAAACAKNPAGC